MRAKRVFNNYEVSEREKIESELSAIPKLSPQIKKITSTEGFADYFLAMRHLYPTQVAAYDRLEDFHTEVTGKRKYAEFDSFRKVLNDFIRNCRSQKTPSRK